jgi:predicted metal-dependent hydrolase
VEPESTVGESGYDSRYLAGIELFNRGEYFDAHEVWEDLWQDCLATDRRFYQALIQAAVAIYHFDRGNHTGAARLFRSGKRYAAPYRPMRQGLDVDDFWRQLEAYLAASLIGRVPASSAPRPTIVLAPAPRIVREG